VLPNGSSPTVIERLTDRQLGHVTRAQLLAHGMSQQAIRTRIRRGDLIRVHHGVYAVGHVPKHAHARSLAAVLACGDGAALSHAAAAALWDVLEWPATLEVTASSYHRRKRITTHRSSTLTAKDIRKRHGVPVTSPARTVLDLQPRLTDARLQRVVNDLRIAGHLSKTAFSDLCARSTKVNALLGDSERPTRSPPEDRFKAFLTRRGLPHPEFNVTIDGREVDALYREQKLIVEIDSWDYHGDRPAFRRDRRKDGRALASGYRTLRVVTDQLDDETAETIRQTLAQYRPSPRA
jgi:very-short-patch-repair endonuclease